MSLLPVPGGILAQLAPAASTAGQMDPSQMLVALANQRAQEAQPQNPGAAIAPAQIEPPTVATNAAPEPQQHHGILGRLGDTLHDPGFRADALRFAIGAMSPGAGGFGNGLAHGLAAASSYHDQRRADAERAAEHQQEMELKNRLATNEERGTAQQGAHFERSDANEGADIKQRGILGGMQIGEQRYGHQVEERNNIRDTGVRRYATDVGAKVETRGQDVQAGTQRYVSDNSVKASQGDNDATIKAATIGAGRSANVKPEDALSGVMQYAPGLIKGFPSDPKEQAAAWADIPAPTQAALAEAYMNANGDPQKFMNSAQSIVGDGASYDDGAGLFNLKDGYKEGEHKGAGRPPANVAGGQGDKQIVKTGTDRNTGRKVVQYSDGTIAYAD